MIEEAAILEEQQIEREERNGNLLDVSGDVVFASALHERLKGKQMLRFEIESGDLPFKNCIFWNVGLGERVDDLRILVRDPLQPAGKGVDSTVSVPVNLHALAIILVFDEHLAAHVRRYFI